MGCFYGGALGGESGRGEWGWTDGAVDVEWFRGWLLRFAFVVSCRFGIPSFPFFAIAVVVALRQPQGCCERERKG